MNIKMKKRLYMFFLFASGCCLSFLVVQPNKIGLLIMATYVIGCTVFSVVFLKNSSGKLKSDDKKSNILSLCFALLAVAFIGTFDGGLPIKYADSGLVSSFIMKLGFDKSVCLSVINIFIMAGAVPILFCFFEYLRDGGVNNGNDAKDFSSKLFFNYCFSVGIVLCVFLLVSSFSYDSSVDDAFSLQLVKRSFSRLTELTAMDFHPPLYYYLLKIFLSVFSLTGIDEIFLGKLFSVVPYIILLLMSLIAYRKDSSRGLSLGFTILLFASFCCFYTQTTAVRMYTWGLLFVTATFFSARTLAEKSGGG